MNRPTCLAFLLGLMGIAVSASADPTCTNLTAKDPQAGDRFGCSLATDGKTLAASASHAAANGVQETGSVTLFTLTPNGNWDRQDSLILAREAAKGDRFGLSLALQGDTLAVGAPLADVPGSADAGAVYVFQRIGSDWVQKDRLTAGNEARRSAAFGQTVALSTDGNLLVVGAPSDSADGSFAGAVFLFTRTETGWERARLAADPAPFDGFGSALALDRDLLIVGAPFADGPAGGSQGEVYVFHQAGATWSLVRRITPDAMARAGAQFGSSVSLDGGTLAVGAVHDDPDGLEDAGAVYVFSRDGSMLLRRLTPPGLKAGDLFGDSVSVSDGNILAGASFHAKDDICEGAAYLFEKGSDKVDLLAEGSSGAQLGHTVLLSGDLALAGACLADGGKGEVRSCQLDTKPIEPPDLLCEIRGDGQPVEPGGLAAYSVRVEYHGAGPETLVTLRVATAQGLSGTECSPKQPCSLQLGHGEVGEREVVFQVPPNSPTAKSIRPVATVSSSLQELTLDNNTCSTTTQVRCRNPFGDSPAFLDFGLSGIIDDVPEKVMSGKELSYRIRFVNGGPGRQPNRPRSELEHTIPLGLTLNSFSDVVLESGGGKLSLSQVSGDPNTTLFWNGALDLCATVSIRVKATAMGANNQRVCLGGILTFDGDRNGTSESSRAVKQACFTIITE